MKKISAVVIVLAMILSMAMMVSAINSPIAPIIETDRSTTSPDETTTRWVTPTHPGGYTPKPGPGGSGSDSGKTTNGGGSDSGKTTNGGGNQQGQPGRTAERDTNGSSPDTGSVSLGKTAAAAALAVVALGGVTVYVSKSKKED